MKVKNINGTSDTTCKCGSWLQHWKNYSGQSLPVHCSEIRCTSRPELGAHVQKVSLYDNNWYIIPLCSSHNKSTGELEIMDSVKLVSANKRETCG